jgi:hypothetical protein
MRNVRNVHTSFRGVRMGLPEGSPTGAWICAAARPAKKVTMEALVYMLTVVFGIRLIIAGIDRVLCSK